MPCANSITPPRRLRACYDSAMPDRPSKTPHRPRDVNARAFQIVQEAAGLAPKAEPEPEKTPAQVAAAMLGRLGGLKGGKARAASMSPERRAAIARKAARTRWGKKRG